MTSSRSFDLSPFIMNLATQHPTVTRHFQSITQYHTRLFAHIFNASKKIQEWEKEKDKED